MIAPRTSNTRTVRDAIGRLRPIAAGEQAPRDPSAYGIQAFFAQHGSNQGIHTGRQLEGLAKKA